MGLSKGRGRFQKGEGGRPKGAKNRVTQRAAEIAEENKFNAIEALIWCFLEAKGQYLEYKKRFEEGRISPMEDNGARYLKTASDNAKEIASFIHPKLKSIEQNKTGQPLDRPLEQVSDEELDAM